MFDVKAVDNTPRHTSDDINAKHAEIIHSGLGSYTKSEAILYLKPGVKQDFPPKIGVRYAVLKPTDEELDNFMTNRPN